ncbi:pentapeptide repeat-containing protein [Algoriphagus sp. D3-2-R+10]|uniref:pentapeptide repeat-containing protein n=1 Tax=Algoriphagus aurantiacus TaxID=3103948 RepID=UPI002B3E57C6|nr:pentapeptide repeat-containing protein [Algoriphagus sp. D3-2-R+10]MEB2777958.1 pentapeptide repeat-containing protein [Algoriphagus sp. D3-2-R+10]
MEKEQLKLENSCIEIIADNMMLDESVFTNVSMQKIKITDANLSDLHVEGAQLGGAIFENIGMPPEDHPAYDANLEQRPLMFENSDLSKSRFVNYNLTQVELVDCYVKGLIINGISIESLFSKLDQ